jgi:hypothetical protein
VTLAARSRPDCSTAHKQGSLSGVIRRIAITDLLVISWAVVGAQLIRFGAKPVGGILSVATPPADTTSSADLKYTAFTLLLIGTWVLMLRLHGAYDRRLLEHGPEEYKVVATASFRLFALVAIASYRLRLDVARGYVAMAMPAGMIGLLMARWLWRKWLTMHRAQGLLSHQSWSSVIAST